jgi:hypothetical protein
MTTKTMVSAAAGHRRAVTAMTMPNTKAEMKVPVRFPIPPTMTTAMMESLRDLLSHILGRINHLFPPEEFKEGFQVAKEAQQGKVEFIFG